MNLLDENFPEDQLPLLKEWHIPSQRIDDVARAGIKDSDIIPVLHKIGRVTFFTQDEDFFRRKLCHAAYCLVWLNIRADDAAIYVRGFLNHPQFRTEKKTDGHGRTRTSRRHPFLATQPLNTPTVDWPQ